MEAYTCAQIRVKSPVRSHTPNTLHTDHSHYALFTQGNMIGRDTGRGKRDRRGEEVGGEKGCRERGGEGEKGSCRGVEVGGSRGRRRGRGRGGEGSKGRGREIRDGEVREGKEVSGR